MNDAASFRIGINQLVSTPKDDVHCIFDSDDV